MAKILDLIYRVKDQASVPIKKISGAQQGFNVSLKDAMKIGTAAAAAFTGVSKTVIDLISEYQDFTIAAGDLAHSLDISTEEASAMMEMSSDLGIEIGTLETAFKAMARNGIDPSIAGLATVREKLDAAATPAERLALAQQLLGKSGADLLPMFDQLSNEQLADYINQMSDAQIVTEEEYQAALRNRVAIDELTDAYDSAKLSLGGFLATGLMPYVEILRSLPALLDAVNTRVRDLSIALGQANTAPQAPVVTGGKPGAGTFRAPILPRPRQAGGPVMSSMPYVVGEKGPELFTPGQSGQITPANDELTREMRRLLRTLPVILRDAVEKAK